MLCFVPSCTHYSEKYPCKFFKFPQNEKTLTKWVNLIRCTDEFPSPSSRICSCHFKNGKKLNLPTLYLRLRNKTCRPRTICKKISTNPSQKTNPTVAASSCPQPLDSPAERMEKSSINCSSTNTTLLTDKVESRKCSCEVSKSIEDPFLLRLLPVEYKYALCELIKGKENQFECKFRVNINSKGEALQWFEEFKYSSNTSYTKAKTYQEDTLGNVFKNVWKCIHNTRPAHTVKLPHRKHTNCPARLIITVKQSLLSRSYKSKDIHLQDFPMVVTIRFIHNHAIENLESLMFDSPDEEIQEIFLNYFNKGYPPSKAMNKFATDMKKDLEYVNFTSYDLSICPDERWVYHFYYRVFRQEANNIYSIKQDSEINVDAKFAKSNAVNPFMEIFENMPETSDILLVDPEGNMELISLPTTDEMNTDIVPTKVEILGNISSEPEPSTKTEVIEQLQFIFDNIIENVCQQDNYLVAAKQFIANSKKFKTENLLICALSDFGKGNI